MTPVDVLHIVNSLQLGGAERNLVETARELATYGYRQHVLSLARSGPLEAELASVGIPVTSQDRMPRVRLPDYRRMLVEIRALRPRVVHTHSPEAAWIGLPAASTARVPIRVKQLQNVYAMWSRKLRWLDRATLGSSSVVAVSPAVARFATARLRYPARQVVTIPNAVAFSRLDTAATRADVRASLGLASRSVAILCVASLSPQKGHAHLLAAFESVLAHEPDAVLLLAGDGSLREELMAAGSRPEVRWLGSRTDVPELLRAADIFVLPSLYEGLPLALIEAAGAGLACVATDIPGNREVLQHAVSGLLVPPRDSSRLADALLRLVRRPELRQSVGISAREHARRRFDVRRIGTEIATLYEHR